MKKKLKSKISINIQRLLIMNDITITELSERLDISKQRLSYMLLNKDDDNWKISNLKTISDALHYNFKDFLLEVLFNERT